MSVSDLRSFLAALDAAGRLRTLDVPVDPYDYEATAIIERLGQAGCRDAVHFRHARPLAGQGLGASLVFNVYGDSEHIAIAFGRPGTGWAELLEVFPTRMRADVPPITADDVPVHEVTALGDDVDLRSLPFCRHVEMEGGPYFTPVIVAREPGGLRHNVSWNRCMYLDPQHVAIHVSPRQLWGYIRTAEELGQPLPVAIVLGHHPLFNQAAASLVPLDRDEYEAAGGLLGEPVRVAPSISYGGELLVPADAEIVLEGEVLPGQRTLEGPFGEFMGYLGPQKLSNVVRVRAVTHRYAPIITEITASRVDHFNACIAIEASLLEEARRAVPSVTTLSWIAIGAATTLAMALRKTADGQPMRAAMAVLAASNIIKQVIVVDDDVDPRDAREVLWAVSSRTRADDDLVIMRGIQGSLLDPSLGGRLGTTGFVIDATMPLDRPYPTRSVVPTSVLERVDLASLFPSLEGSDADHPSAVR